MKEYKASKIRNVAVVGHNGSGKTTLGDFILYKTGVNSRIGSVENGSSMLDVNQFEIDKQVTILSKIYQVEYKDTKINFLDTPGYADFTGEVKGAVEVVENTLFMIDSQSGIEVGTAKAMEYVEKIGCAKSFFINRMDKEHADFDKVLDMLKDNYGNGITPLVIPIGFGPKFKGVIDLLKMKAFEYTDGKTNEIDIPADFKDKAEELRSELVDNIAETDDELMEKFFEAGELTDEEIIKGLKAGYSKGDIMPLFCGIAKTGAGVDLLLDAISDMFISPKAVEKVQVLKGDETELIDIDLEGPFSGLVYKLTNEQHMGDILYLRVYSGTIAAGDEVQNPTKNSKEKIGQMYNLMGKNKVEVKEASAGDFVALVKLKTTKTNDTLADKKVDYELKPITFPKPVMSVAISTKNKGDEDKLGAGLSKLNEEDPSFKVEVNPEIKQTLLYGMGETHLEYLTNKLKNRFNVEVELEKPRIPYKETIQGKSECHKKYKKQSGGKGQYGEVYMRLAPVERGGGLEFLDSIVGGAIPGKFVPAVEKGIKEGMDKGIIAGYPIVDIQVDLYDGSFHPVDSSEMAFKLAASMALQEGMKNAKPCLLEPVYKVEVKVPEEFLGDVMGDLSSRRGKISGIDQEKSFQVIKAEVPLAELYKYSTILRSLTQGRGIFTSDFVRYDPVPHDVAEKVIEETAKMREEEENK